MDLSTLETEFTSHSSQSPNRGVNFYLDSMSIVDMTDFVDGIGVAANFLQRALQYHHPLFFQYGHASRARLMAS